MSHSWSTFELPSTHSEPRDPCPGRQRRRHTPVGSPLVGAPRGSSPSASLCGSVFIVRHIRRAGGISQPPTNTVLRARHLPPRHRLTTSATAGRSSDPSASTRNLQASSPQTIGKPGRNRTGGQPSAFPAWRRLVFPLAVTSFPAPTGLNEVTKLQPLSTKGFSAIGGSFGGGRYLVKIAR
jgi:hypothetical protein